MAQARAQVVKMAAAESTFSNHFEAHTPAANHTTEVSIKVQAPDNIATHPLTVCNTDAGVAHYYTLQHSTTQRNLFTCIDTLSPDTGPYN